MDFDQWMVKVNKIFATYYHGMTSDDFPDFLWWESYNKGRSPCEAFRKWRKCESF